MDATLARLADQIRTARAAKGRLRVVGGGSKAFYGNAASGEPLDMTPLAGIAAYEPSELVVTVRAGTPLGELEAALAERGQCLAFEPPRFAMRDDGTHTGTVGGMVAAGLAGPARVAAGAVRDHLLGAKLLDGRGELLAFGGQVMKNVAGYDVARTLAGSMGMLGAICEVSLKVLPVAPATATIRFECEQAAAIARLNQWGGQPLPINASAWWHGMLVVRLAGAQAAVRAAQQQLGGEAIEPGLAAEFWRGLRDQQDEFFVAALQAVARGESLWRLSLPATTAPLGLVGDTLIEWGGAQRWLVSGAAPATVREACSRAGGHATLWRARDKRAGAFHPLPVVQQRIQTALMDAFDPDRVFDRARMWPAS